MFADESGLKQLVQNCANIATCIALHLTLEYARKSKSKHDGNVNMQDHANTNIQKEGANMNPSGKHGQLKSLAEIQLWKVCQDSKGWLNSDSKSQIEACLTSC